MRVRVASCLGLLLLLSASISLAEGITFTGSTTAGSPQFNLPNESGSGTIGLRRYQVQPFQIPTATTCFIYGSQDYDGWLVLYRSPFNPASPLVNFVDGDDDGDLGIGSSQLDNLALTAGEYVLVNSAFSSGGFGNFQTAIHCDNQPITAPCNGFVYSTIPTDQSTCLIDRFLVAIDSVSASPTGGIATPVRLGSSDTGIFWFYNPQNFEVIIKAIDGCGFNNRWWIFAGALTDQQYRILVFDTHNPSAGIKTYFHGIGTPAPAVTDTSAFATCP